MRTFQIIISLAILMLAPLAAANVTREEGSHTITVSWAHEPPMANERNAIIVQIWETDTELPVSGIAEGLVMTARFENQTKPLALTESTEVPGVYHTPLEPTKPGQFSFHGEFQIGSRNLTIDIELEAVRDGSGDRFPVDLSETSDLGSKIEALTARVGALEAKATTQSNTPATVTLQPPPNAAAPVPFVGAVAIISIAALLGLMMRRKEG